MKREHRVSLCSFFRHFLTEHILTALHPSCIFFFANIFIYTCVLHIAKNSKSSLRHLRLLPPALDDVKLEFLYHPQQQCALFTFENSHRFCEPEFENPSRTHTTRGSVLWTARRSSTKPKLPFLFSQTSH